MNLDAKVPPIFITVHPDTLTTGALRSVGAVLIIGHESLGLIETLSRSFSRPCPSLPKRGPEVGEAVYLACRTDEP